MTDDPKAAHPNAPPLKARPLSNTANTPPRRPRKALWLWGLGVVLAVATVLTGGFYLAQGRDIAVPAWMRGRIEARLAAALPAHRLTFGDMIMVLDEGWRPRALVRDFRLSDQDGSPLIEVSQVRASLAMRPLLRQEFELKSLDIQGVFLNLRRGRDGAVTLSSGAAGAAGALGASTGVAQLLSGLTAELGKPGLRALKRASLRALTLRYEDLQAERAWTVDGGRLRLTRLDDKVDLAADFALLGGGDGAATLEANYSGKIGSLASEFGVNLADMPAADIATQGPAFAWLEPLRASISGALRGGVDEEGNLRSLNATLQISQGVIQPNPQAKPIPIDAARSYFSYDPGQGVLRFDELSVQSPWLSGRLEGQSFLSEVQNGTITEMVGQFNLAELRANPQDLFTNPVRIEAAQMDFRLRLDPLELTIGRFGIADQGSHLEAKAKIAALEQGWAVQVDGALDRLSHQRLLAFWPEGAAQKPRKWLVEKLAHADLHDIQFAMRKRPDHPAEPFFSFGFRNAQADILPNFPPLGQGRGHASLVRDRFVLRLDRGFVRAPKGGWVSLAGSHYILPDVRIKENPPGLVRLSASGAIPAALSLINLPPKAVMDDAGLPETLAAGQVDITGTIAFPVQKKPPPGAVRFDLTGQLRDVQSDVLVKGRVLRAAQLDLAVSNDEISIRGAGDLDGMPFDARWRQPLAAGARQPGQVAGQVTLSPSNLARFGLEVPAGLIAGSAAAQITVDLPPGAPASLTLSSDLDGLALAYPALGWGKAADTKGHFASILALTDPPAVQEFDLRAAGLDLSGTVNLTSEGTLARAQLSRLRLDDWLDVQASLTGQDPGQPPKLAITGGRVDLGRASFGAGATGQGGGMDVALDRLQLTPGLALAPMQGVLSTGAGLSGRFRGRLNGQARIDGQIQPQNGRSAIRIQSADAGAVLAAAGILNKAEGGQLDLALVPQGAAPGYLGQLTIRDVSLLDAPVIAALLNAVSVVGLLDELGGKGIAFSTVSADFALNRDELRVTKASAVGPSIGLSMDGILNLKTAQLAMQGVLSPVYLINGIGSVLTREGEGVIGFNYELTGPAKAPVVTVNPLSALAPSIFRQIFRKPAPKP